MSTPECPIRMAVCPHCGHVFQVEVCREVGGVRQKDDGRAVSVECSGCHQCFKHSGLTMIPVAGGAPSSVVEVPVGCS